MNKAIVFHIHLIILNGDSSLKQHGIDYAAVYIYIYYRYIDIDSYMCHSLIPFRYIGKCYKHCNKYIFGVFRKLSKGNNIWARFWRIKRSFSDNRRRKSYFKQRELTSKFIFIWKYIGHIMLCINVHCGWKIGGEEAKMRMERWVKVGTEGPLPSVPYI